MVCAGGVDVSAFGEPFALQHGAGRAGHRDYHVGVARALFGAFHRRNLYAKLRRHLIGKRLPVLRLAAEHPRRLNRAHFADRLQLGARLIAGADDAHACGVRARHILGGDAARRARAYLPQVGRLDQRQQFARVRAEYLDIELDGAACHAVSLQAHHAGAGRGGGHKVEHAARQSNARARAVGSAAVRKQPKRLFHRIQRNVHSQYAVHIRFGEV